MATRGLWWVVSILMALSLFMAACNPVPTPITPTTPAVTDSPVTTPTPIIVPSDILAPVAGPLEVIGPTGTSSNDRWCFNQNRQSLDGVIGHIVGGGIGRADDTYAWDVNLYPGDADAGKPVYAIAEGVVSEAYGSITTRNYGQVLIEHSFHGNTWWSGYLHMRDIQVVPGENVTQETILGYISNVPKTEKIPNHLHFVVYTGSNTLGGLVSFNANIIERTALPSAKPSSPKPVQVPVSWVAETVDSAGDVGTDSSLAFDGTGNPAISYYDQTNGDLKYARWNGANWLVQTVDSISDVGKASSLYFDQAGNPAIIYYDSSSRVLKYAQWNGISWNITIVGAAYWSYKNSLVFDTSGMPVIAFYDYPACDLKYARFNGNRWDIQLVYRDDLGVGWGRMTSLAMDSSGTPAIAFREPDVGLRYAHWNGTSWEVKMVDSGYGTGADASLRFDPKGYPAIAYVWQGVYDGPSSLKIARFNGTSWNTETFETDGSKPSIAFDRSGNATIAYYHVQDANLMYARWDGSHWCLEVIDSAGDVGIGNSLAFDAQGNPAISYYDKTNGNLKFAILR